MKYMLIHTIDPNTEHGTDGMPDFDSWLDEMLARGVTLHGDRLQEVSDATTVQVRNRELLVSDGPFAETKEQIAGYDGDDPPVHRDRGHRRHHRRHRPGPGQGHGRLSHPARGTRN